MRSIISLGLTALVACTSTVSAETTIAVLEFGPGGSVHRTTSSVTESNSAAVSSLWKVLHGQSKNTLSSRHEGMSVAPDLFAKADAGIVLGLRGESIKSMPAAAVLLDAAAPDVVGHIHVPGRGAGADLLKDAESVSGEDVGRRLQSTAESAARGDLPGGMAALSLAVEDDKSAAIADEQLGRMLKILKEQAAASGKTVVLHLVAEEGGRRRLSEDENKEEEEENQNNYAYSNEKTMYEIQSYNLYLWTSIGLVTVVFSVMSAFVAMPLMPDTLLFGELSKIAGSD